MKSLYSWVKKSEEEEQEQKVANDHIDPFTYPKLAADNWPLIYAEHSGKEREGLPMAWGKAFPFLEVETLVPEVRILGPRVRCGFCYRNNPKNMKNVLYKRIKFKVKRSNVARRNVPLNSPNSKKKDV